MAHGMRLSMAAGLALLAPLTASAQHCSPEWLTDSFGVPGTAAPGHPTGIVNALAVLDDGTGITLYASGLFSSIGGSPATSIGRWDGSAWQGMTGLAGRITALGIYDDGSGPALYAGGNFSQGGGQAGNAIVRWTGQNWAPLGTGLTRTAGNAAAFVIEVFDGGTGPSLYVGGSFQFAGGLPALNFARWDGIRWHAAGDTSGTVNRLIVWNDGGGEALYAGGNIVEIGGVPAAGIAKLDQTGWSALGSGVTGSLGRVNSIAVYSAPAPASGDALYIGGDFTMAGGIPVESIAVWDGLNWSALPGGGVVGGNASVMAVYDDGEGPALFVGGGFSSAGGTPVNSIARWKDGQWSDMQGGVMHPSITTVTAMAVYDDGMGLGPMLHVGGGFTEAGGQPAFSLSRWACFGVCYANCIGNTTEPILTVDDFTCFINEFSAALTLPHEQQLTHYANCDGSTTPPVLNVDDFTCFINAFAAGCP